MELIEDGIRVTLEHIGEGHSGDYDPDDPKDEALLRFDVERLTDSQWEGVDNTSYCTNLTDDTPDETVNKALRIIMDCVKDKILRYDSVKRICEELSWMDVKWATSNKNPFKKTSYYVKRVTDDVSE